jgi:NADH:ubiquinone oxidoreductase subunit 4 (subunit M)
LINLGVNKNQPSINLFWFLIIASNMATPPSLNLIRELFICIRILRRSLMMFIPIIIITIIRAAYNLYIFSSLQTNKMNYKKRFLNSSSTFIVLTPLAMLPFLLIINLQIFTWFRSLIKALNF